MPGPPDLPPAAGDAVESSVRIRAATIDDAPRISELLTSLAEEFIVGRFGAEGRRHLLAHFDVAEMKARLESAEYRFHVAASGNLLVGVIALRGGAHLQYLFVHWEYHRAGWARRLWDHARREAISPSGRFTVNASGYAVPAYERLGFRIVGGAQEKDGVRFQPMEWIADRRGVSRRRPGKVPSPMPGGHRCYARGIMNKTRLIYFDAPVSRGEECRLALHLAGIDFDDVRIKMADWPALKEQMPYGALPVLDLPGAGAIAHANAILVLIGRRSGLHPADDVEAARHEGMMQHVEDLRAKVSPTLRLGEAEKKAAREALVAEFLPGWGRAAERNIARGPFFGGDRLHVVDLKIYMAVRWFNGGNVDHIPATIFASYPKLIAVHDAVRDHPGVQRWYAKSVPA